MNTATASDCTITLHAQDGANGGHFLTIDFSELPLRKLVTLGSHGKMPGIAYASWYLASYNLRQHFRDRLPGDDVLDIDISTTDLKIIVRCRHNLSKPVQDVLVESLNDFGVTVSVT